MTRTTPGCTADAQVRRAAGLGASLGPKAGTGAKPGGVADANVGSGSTRGQRGGTVDGKIRCVPPSVCDLPRFPARPAAFPRDEMGGGGQGRGEKGETFQMGRLEEIRVPMSSRRAGGGGGRSFADPKFQVLAWEL